MDNINYEDAVEAKNLLVEWCKQRGIEHNAANDRIEEKLLYIALTQDYFLE